MVIQSYDGFIQLLPDLPDAKSDGQLAGLIVREGFIVDLKWKDKKVQEVRICAMKSNSTLLRNPFDEDIEVWRNGVKEEVVMQDELILL